MLSIALLHEFWNDWGTDEAPVCSAGVTLTILPIVMATGAHFPVIWSHPPQRMKLVKYAYSTSRDVPAPLFELQALTDLISLFACTSTSR